MAVAGSCSCRRGGVGVGLASGRAWRADSRWSLDGNHHWRACFEEADCRIGVLWRLIGIEPEVIQRAEANRVGVLILRESFRVPGYRACVLRNSPRCAAITLVVECAIICPTGFLTRRMKSDVRDVYSGSEGTLKDWIERSRFWLYSAYS